MATWSGIRKLHIEDIEDFWHFLHILDQETNFMMFEPDERERHTNIQELEDDIQNNVINGNDCLQIAVENDKVIGYIRAERGRFNRIAHTAYIVTGILKEYNNRGIGTAFFQNLNKWAKENGIIRLELTVECHNTAARRLYEKSGFQIEGIRRKSMLVAGGLVDEYYMAAVL